MAFRIIGHITSAKISCNSPSVGQHFRDLTIVPISLENYKEIFITKGGFIIYLEGGLW